MRASGCRTPPSAPCGSGTEIGNWSRRRHPRQTVQVRHSAQSAPTSGNLQLWSVVAVRDADRRTRLAKLAGEQNFIAQAPLFLVWLADLARARHVTTRRGDPQSPAGGV
ncbi:nitroreductase family protein [Kribbella sp. NPDC004875]|uniref:nitroreductase family protein n=1 Tax=Kribbella sp. NPDC004875 TaxID=3364107 RepID=UPI0036AFE9AF